MNDFNSQNNRVVWMDIPVADLKRASSFYESVLNIKVHQEKFENFEFGVLDHQMGNGGCLIINPDAITDKGMMVYFNTDGRIKDAMSKVESSGGKVIEPVHAIGPHGFRSIVLDSEGNRIVLHSNTDE